MSQAKTEFRNDSGGIVGVVTIEPGGKTVSIPVKPGASVWLSEDEQIATANAPVNDEDNPFINGQLTKVTEAADIKNRRPIGSNADSPEAAEQKRKAQEAAAALKAANEEQQKTEAARLKQGQEQATTQQPAQAPPRQRGEETAAPPQPQGSQAAGSRAAGEEVGTPEAVGKA
jgi:hypothetical protein